MTSKPRVHIKGSRMPSAEAATVGLKQCRQAQDQLEDAINGVMKAEQQLRENAREVRGELQSCVSRQQEALRCREVWLLGQIELLEHLKTETLQQQLHHLHWLRGQFDVIVHQLQNSNSSNDLNNQLTSCMEKLSSLSLTPEETPEMSFHADTRSLRQAITSFGSITAQEGVSSQSPAHQRGQVQSCPIAAKKQKLEVGALSDWLLGSPAVSSAPIGYQASKNPQDWLMAHKESKVRQTSCPVLASVDYLQAWGQLRDLEAWLLQDQSPVSRARTDSSCSSSFSIEKIDESEFTVAPDDDDEGEELSDWLITPPTVAMETLSDAERWRQVLKPFEGGWASDDWLAGSGRPPADCSSCCQTAKAVEIENLGRLKCLKTPPASGPASPTGTAAPVTAAALEAWLQQVAPVQQACRANEVCSAYSDCVCEENCAKDALSAWLLRQDGRDKNGVSVAKNGPPADKNATPADKNGPPADKNAPPADKNGPPADKNAPPADKNATPADKNGPPADKNGPPADKNGPPADKNAPPADKNSPPADKNATTVTKNATTVTKNATPVTKNATTVTKNATPTLHLREQEQKVQAILEAWLHPSNTSSCRTPLQALSSSLSGWVKASREDHSSQFKLSSSSSSSSSSPFQRPLDPDLWVFPGQTPPPPPGSGGQPRPAEEEDKWLLRKRSQAQERLALPAVCDLFSCMKVGGDKEKWLHKAPEQM